MKKDDTITIKRATKDDANIVSQIVALSYKDCQEKFKPDFDNIPSWMAWWESLSMPLPKEHLNFIERDLVYLIILNDVIIGSFRLEKHEEKSELDDFCILPEYQNNGYGTYTLSLINTLCTNCITLSTPYSCISNQHLYRKAGYNQVGTSSNNTVICFEKKLEL